MKYINCLILAIAIASPILAAPQSPVLEAPPVELSTDELQWKAIQDLALMVDQLAFIMHKIKEDPGTGPTFKPIIESALQEWKVKAEEKIKQLMKEQSSKELEEKNKEIEELKQQLAEKEKKNED